MLGNDAHMVNDAIGGPRARSLGACSGRPAILGVMDDDDHVCLCFAVSQRKLVSYLKRERPTVASQLSDCLGAGTGCQWCVPFLRELHRQWAAGEEPHLESSHESYARDRRSYRSTGRRPTDQDDESTC